AGKAAAEMIVDSALADAGERELHRREIARVVRALSRPPQKLEQHGLREFGRAAYAAVDRVDHANELIGGAVEVGCSDRHVPLGPCARRQRAAIALHALWILAEHALYLAQEVDEGGLSVA